MRRKSLLNLRKSLDRRPLEFESRISEKEKEIMFFVEKVPVTAPVTTKIINAADIMINHKIRRLPIVDSGTRRMIGILSATDIVNFLGGGEKYKIIEKKCQGNFFAAINLSVREIMSKEVISINEDTTVEEAIEKIVKNRVGGLPITNEDGKVIGFISERDFVRHISETLVGYSVGDVMSRKVITASPDMRLIDLAKLIISKGYRRLPVLHENELTGIISTSDLIRALGKGEIFDHCTICDGWDIMNISIEKFMSRDVLFTNPDKDLGDIARIMDEKTVGGLPVLENGKIVGMITSFDLLRSIYS